MGPPDRMIAVSWRALLATYVHSIVTLHSLIPSVFDVTSNHVFFPFFLLIFFPLLRVIFPSCWIFLEELRWNFRVLASAAGSWLLSKVFLSLCQYQSYAKKCPPPEDLFFPLPSVTTILRGFLSSHFWSLARFLRAILSSVLPDA